VLSGRSHHRVGARERVTGAQRYAADLPFGDVLHVKLVHLPVGRASIKSVDCRDALRAPGVACVLTAADLPQPVPRFGPAFVDRPILATGETRFFRAPGGGVGGAGEDAGEAAA